MVDRTLKSNYCCYYSFATELQHSPKRPLRWQCHIHCLLSVCLLGGRGGGEWGGFLPVWSKVTELEKSFEESQADCRRHCVRRCCFCLRVIQLKQRWTSSWKVVNRSEHQAKQTVYTEALGVSLSHRDRTAVERATRRPEHNPRTDCL